MEAGSWLHTDRQNTSSMVHPSCKPSCIVHAAFDMHFFFSHVRFDVGNTTAAAVLTLLFTHCNKMIASFPGPTQPGNEANKMMVITILQN